MLLHGVRSGARTPNFNVVRRSRLFLPPWSGPRIASGFSSSVSDFGERTMVRHAQSLVVVLDAVMVV